MIEIHPVLSWGLAAAALVAGWFGYGWPGLVLAVSVIVFWLLLQFSRALRALRRAGSAPVGHVASAVMLHSRLHQGMTLVKLFTLTGSLGERVEPPLGGAQESWRWRDAGGATVTVNFRRGRTQSWALQRPEEPGASLKSTFPL